MTHGLRGRAVVVTGSSRGIGVGIVERLLASGAHVLGVSRSGASRAAGGALVQIECDLLSPAAPEVVLDAALDAFGRVDGLVNNAGLLLDGACWEQPDAELDAMLAINLTAPFRLSQRLAAHWLENGAGKGSGRSPGPRPESAGEGSGRSPGPRPESAGEGSGPGPGPESGQQARGAIVNVCSIESQVGWAEPPQAAYAASKGGLLGLTRAMALELAPRGIRVVAVGPGAIATAMTPAGPAVTDAIPLECRLGTPQEVGDVVAFLLSDAASYITGEIVYADGGYLLA